MLYYPALAVQCVRIANLNRQTGVRALLKFLQLPLITMIFGMSMMFLEKYWHHRAEIGRMARFLLVGGWNTVFGVGIYALLYSCLHRHVHYLVLLIPANVLAITNAYLGYKWLVFRTKGNFWREYFRCYVVYGGTMLLGFVIMFALVDGCGLNPMISQFVCVAVTTVCSYFSHRNFSFRRQAEKEPIT